MPGQRSIVMVSPGFLTLADLLQEKTEIIDRAIRANVVISALNARGLYAIIPGGDASQPSPQSIAGAIMRARNIRRPAALAEEDVLAEMAYGTGGVFFHNNNDLVEGFKRVAARPEFVYVLGFSPQNLKLDGRLHSLKVTLQKLRQAGPAGAQRLLCAPASGRPGGDRQAGNPGRAVLARGAARHPDGDAHAVFQAQRGTTRSFRCWLAWT